MAVIKVKGSSLMEVLVSITLLLVTAGIVFTTTARLMGSPNTIHKLKAISLMDKSTGKNSGTQTIPEFAERGMLEMKTSLVRPGDNECGIYLVRVVNKKGTELASREIYCCK